MFKESDIKDIYSLSPMQEGILFHYLANKGSSIYFEQTVLLANGHIQIHWFEQSFIKLVEKYDIFRTVFIYKGVDKPRQVVLRKRDTGIFYQDISDMEETEKRKFIEEFKRKDIERGFDLERDVLIRISIFKTSNKTYEIIWSLHHIIMDGWCLGIVLKDFLDIYGDLKKGRTLRLRPVKPYSDYIKWLQKQDKEEAINYWRNYLENYEQQAVIPKDGKEKEGGDLLQEEHEFLLDKMLTGKLNNMARQNQVTLNTIFQTAWGILLQRYTNTDDVVFGCVVSGRPVEMPGSETMVGLFINTIPVRVICRPRDSFLQLAVRVQKEFIVSEKYSFLSLAEIQSVSLLKQNLLGNVIVFENYPVENILKESSADETIGFSAHNVYTLKQVVYDMGMGVVPADELFFCIVNNGFAYRADTIEKLGERLIRIFEQVAENPGIAVKDIQILTVKEKEIILYDFNDTSNGDLKGKTINRIFEEQVEKTPDHVALLGQSAERKVQSEEEKRSALCTFPCAITYRELNEKANQLAYLLIEKGVEPGTFIAMMVNPSAEMIIGIMGILKAGGAYVPIDPRFPRNRRLSMLEDCDASILLTETPVVEKQSFTALQNPGLVELEVQKTRTRQQITDFESLPIPNRFLVNYEKFNNYIGQAMVRHCISMQATRGCPYKCAFCHKIWPKRHVVRSAQHIFAELKLYYDIGVRRFALIDDIFNLNIENSKRFFELIIENRLKLQLFFPNGIRADIMTKEYIDLMVKAGTVNMAFALETASPRLQKLIKKNVDLKKFRENLEYVCEKYPQVIVELFTMHGYPSETEEEAMMTMNFIKSLKWVHFPYVFILRIFHNTDMEKLALENGITQKAINASQNSAFHELPETLPFDKSFTLKYQADFTNNYFLSKERLLHVLPYQMKSLIENEMVQKYNSYLPVPIKRLADLLELVEIKEDELGTVRLLAKDYMSVPNLNEKIKRCFPAKKPRENALRVLLLDLSQKFRSESDLLNDMVEPPLGLMYLMSYLNQELGDKVNGKIVKSSVDFDSYAELKPILYKFKPDVIGIRTLTVSKDFFHKTTAMIRLWGIDVPIITGGPYATSDYTTILKDRNIDLAVLGEGEITFNEVIQKIIDNNGKLPAEEVLKEIDGIAFIQGKEKSGKKFAREIVILDELPRALSDQSRENPLPVNQSTDLAYAIYTSGSTGKPKGTLTTHHNVNRVARNTNYIDIRENDRLLQLSNYAFDGSVFDIFGALLNGAPLVLMERDDVLSVDKLSDLIKREKITVFFVTTALFNALVDLQINCFENIRKVLFGGERVSLEHSRKALKYLGKDRIIHVYGPTETTVYATYYFINQIEGRSATIPIGKPITNTSVYILDKELKPVPLGINGEVYIGGHGLARGYLNRPELTADKFIKNPFYKLFSHDSAHIATSHLLYRTGDLARWLDNGNIEFIGRTDHQVKLRGFRVELGEIENRLLNHNHIKQALVLEKIDEKGGNYLCAYIIADIKLEISELRKYLSEDLPDYMLPSYFVPLEKIPLTSNGKVDKNDLPAVEAKAGVCGVGTAPRNEIEKKLVEVWQKVLGVEEIGINHNFFEMGGDSIKSIQIASRMQKYGMKLEVESIFKYPTIAELSSHVKTTYDHVDQGTVQGEVILAPIQRWFWEKNRNTSAVHHFNQSVMLFCRQGFRKEILEKVFKTIVEHHDALRLVFKRQESGVIQVNRGIRENFIELPVYDMKKKPGYSEFIEEEANKLQRSINLSEGPLMKLALFETMEGDHLLIVIHHLIVDGISWRILLEDFTTGYKQLEKGEEVNLPQKTMSYKEWTQKLIEYSRDQKLLETLGYWKRVMETGNLAILPKEVEVTLRPGKDRRTISISLTKKQTELILKEVHRAYNTEINDILLAALGITVKEWAGGDRVWVNLEGHGREKVTAGMDITRTIGWFTSVYPVVIDIGDTENLSLYIKNTKEMLRNIPDKGMSFGILKYLTPVEYKKELNFQNKPEIGFNYLGQFDQDVNSQLFEISGISPGIPVNPGFESEHALDVSGILVRGTLDISLAYDKNEFTEHTMKTFINNYKYNLEKIIRHCTKKEDTELTVSDLSTSVYNQQEVEEISNNLLEAFNI